MSISSNISSDKDLFFEAISAKIVYDAAKASLNESPLSEVSIANYNAAEKTALNAYNDAVIANNAAMIAVKKVYDASNAATEEAYYAAKNVADAIYREEIEVFNAVNAALNAAIINVSRK